MMEVCEQLQRKHEELQQMLMLQEEQLRLIKEQLMVARMSLAESLPNIANAPNPIPVANQDEDDIHNRETPPPVRRDAAQLPPDDYNPQQGNGNMQQ